MMSDSQDGSQSPAELPLSSHAEDVQRLEQIKKDPVLSQLGQDPSSAQTAVPAVRPNDALQQSYCVVRSQTGAITEIIVRLDVKFIKSIPGIINILLFIMLTVAWGCCGEVNRYATNSKVQFALFAYVTAWMMVLLFFLIHVLQIHKGQTFPQSHWAIVCLIVHSVWMMFVLVGASLLASEAKYFVGVSAKNNSLLQKIINNFWAALVFGFISWFLLAATVFFYFINYNDNRRQQLAQTRYTPSQQPTGQLQFTIPADGEKPTSQGEQVAGSAFQEVQDDA